MDPLSTDPPQTQPQPRLARRIWTWLGELYSPTLALAALGLIAYFVFVGPPPIWPFLTTGQIHVESPEVYTRERLVNDRYRQDFWLKSQLDALDGSVNLIREFRTSQVEGGVNAEAPAPAGEANDGIALPFQEEFMLRSAMRDKIRQMVLENLLDDRHDLTGNSIYGLKFDTAVLPGANTFARPFVAVTINIEALEEGGKKADPVVFLSNAAFSQGADPGGPFDNATRQFERWKGNLEGRLNRYLDASRSTGRCQAPSPDEAILAQGAGDKLTDAGIGGVEASAPSFVDATPASDVIDDGLVKKALLQVMGIDAREISIAPPRQSALPTSVAVDLPEPWSKFFTLQIRNISTQQGVADWSNVFVSLSINYFTVFLVEESRWLKFYAGLPKDANGIPEKGLAFQQVKAVHFEAPEPTADDAEAGGAETADAAPAPDGPSFYLLSPLTRVIDPQGRVAFRGNPLEWQFAKNLSQTELRSLRMQAPPEQCLVSSPDGRACDLAGQSFLVNASLYNFIRAVAQVDAYSYAVFPRGDVEGVLSDATLAAAARLGEGDAGGPGLGGFLRSQTAGAEPVVINFAGGQSSDAFDFGWAIVRPGIQEPMQVSQLVLVSVPAYLDELNLSVDVGWLGRGATRIGGGPGPVDIKVVLPPDYEALDTLVVGGTRRHGPVIDESQVCGDIAVTACKDADILIAGERLWRSTSVTLGAQTADRITVMPDMRGIVASFEPVDLPPAGEDERAQDLIVWTSEGSAKLPFRAKVRSDGATACAK